MSPDSWTTGGQGRRGGRRKRSCNPRLRGGWRGRRLLECAGAKGRALVLFTGQLAKWEKFAPVSRRQRCFMPRTWTPRSFASQRVDDVYEFFNRVTYFTHCPRRIIPTAYKREKISFFFIAFVGQISQVNDMLEIQAHFSCTYTHRLLKINRNLNKVYCNNNLYTHTLS